MIGAATLAQLLGRAPGGVRVFERGDPSGVDVNFYVGGTYGAQAAIWFAPERGVGVAVSANVYQRFSGAVFAAASERLLGDVLAAVGDRA